MTDFAVETRALSKSYGERLALSPLSLTVSSGEVFGLLGHNGAGKTTTVGLLTTLLKPTSGEAEVGGFSVASEGNKVRSVIGYLPENVQFYDNLSLMENLLFFARLSKVNNPKRRIQEVLELLSFTGHENSKLGGFSKGMRQRVGIAQAILHNPKVLFLDEPTSGLDPEGVRSLREIIMKLNTQLGMTIFMNTHLLSEVTKVCTSIGILRQGTLVYQDSLESTLARFPGEDALEQIYFQLEQLGTE